MMLLLLLFFMRDWFCDLSIANGVFPILCLLDFVLTLISIECENEAKIKRIQQI